MSKKISLLVMGAFVASMAFGPLSQAHADVFEELADAPSAETITCEEAINLSPVASMIVLTSAASYLAGVQDWRYTDNNLEKASEFVIEECSQAPQMPLIKILEELARP